MIHLTSWLTLRILGSHVSIITSNLLCICQTRIFPRTTLTSCYSWPVASREWCSPLSTALDEYWILLLCTVTLPRQHLWEGLYVWLWDNQFIHLSVSQTSFTSIPWIIESSCFNTAFLRTMMSNLAYGWVCIEAMSTEAKQWRFTSGSFVTSDTFRIPARANLYIHTYMGNLPLTEGCIPV